MSSSILASRYPAKLHFENVLKQLPQSIVSAKGAVIAVAGNPTPLRYGTDVELDFRQNQDFVYLTGAEEHDFAVVYDIAARKLVLIAPRISNDEAVWIGVPPTASELSAKYECDELRYNDELSQVLAELNPTAIYMLNSQDPAKVLPSEFVALADTSDALIEAIHEARMFKTPYEVELMRHANKVSSEAHAELMKNVRTGINERHLHALFKDYCFRNELFNQAYNAIVGRGTNAAILHYGKNSADITNESDVVLVDAGGEYRGYASDITLGKKFTDDARFVYETVLDMQHTVLGELKPGVQWEDMHRLAESRLLDALYKSGIVNSTVPKSKAVELHVPAIFFPHGLGHSIGIDVHDTNGYPKGVERIQEPGIRYLRMRRQLQPGMVVTVEPGFYFVDMLIDEALGKPEFEGVFNVEVLNRFRKVGGVRIEDNVLITENGIDNLTIAPKTVAEIEALRQ
ncbi:hypothetical protein GQ42DRAFT_167707 [Ramicandelaber brevisporus]|nr:hypothetical protein GQ42DRAFT_167707 [Ramicandelaber brevisporus]